MYADERTVNDGRDETRMAMACRSVDSRNRHSSRGGPKEELQMINGSDGMRVDAKKQQQQVIRERDERISQVAFAA